MKNMKRILTLLLALIMVVSVFAACDQEEQGDKEVVKGENTTYTITVKTVGGMTLPGVSVAVYTDGAMQDLQAHAATDANGKAVFTMPEYSGYVAVLSGVPKGYSLEQSYPLSGTNTVITLKSALVSGENLGDVQLGLGDVMYDFTVTTPDGTEVTLSKMLEEKEAVLINFWYTGCSWCVTEFPFMETAYQMYQDKIGIVALDPLNEGNEAIAAFPGSQGLNLTFPMAACPPAWANTFGVAGYPTSVVIDRYGVIVLIEEGAITSLRPFTCLFDTLTGDDYEQKLYTNVGEVITVPEPTYEMASSEEIAAILGTSELAISFHPEEDEKTASITWPFIETEKNGVKCLKASNSGIDDSYAILYADVTLKKGQALGFEFLRSSESAADVLYVIVDGEDINSISGYLETETWEKCYPVVAEEDGVYEVALCYLKDSDGAVGDDTVYIRSMQIVDVSQIDAPTYLPRQASTTEDGFTYSYVDIVLSSKDGYYHVGSEDGPLLLADLMNYTQFNEEATLWNMAFNGDIVLDGVNYVDAIEQYSNYALNSQLYGICPVNQTLYDLLQVVDKVQGFDEADDKEWLKLCKYFVAYGTDGQQLEDPIAGLAPFSAYTAKLGKNVESNYFYYNRHIMPRGMFAEFIPNRSGAYRITSRTPSGSDVDGWIFDENKQILLTYEWDERMFTDSEEVSMVFYMEAGKPYYINIAFWDPYEIGYIYYDIEFLGSKYSHFRLCSPGPHTYDSDATGEDMYHIITGGIDVVLGNDGIYYHDLGDGKKGSKIYVDFTGTNIFNTPIATVGDIKGLLDQGAFDFSKSEYDDFVIKSLSINGNDQEKTLEYLKKEWGEEYESNYEMFCVEDVFAGIYHGEGEDMSSVVRKYLSKMEKRGEKAGCVVLTEELAEALQMLMDKYVFQNVDHAWTKLCYYYDYMG